MSTPLQTLQQYWGYPAFRPLQEEIIQSALDEKDTLALLPTGGGKSICFQVPALCSEGLCIVVSPLIALMKDQVEQLKKRDIKAVAIYSGMNRREIDITLDNCIYGGVKFLYVSPERLKTELFLERAKQMNISLLAIDEAHCISQWGYDFRPPYLEIADFRNALNIQRIIALTATATKEVKKDICEKLGFNNPQIFQKSFARKNLSYSAFKLESKEQKLVEILNNVSGSSVVYVRSRKRTQEIAAMLVRNKISADFYHAGLLGKDRAKKQEDWINNQIRVIVATNAFGMGIDKPDVRTVIHLDLPDSLEAYYQEAGRAGRDEKKAFAVALYHTQDVTELKERVEQSIASMDEIKRTYRALANYSKLAIGSFPTTSFDFDLDHFLKTYNLPLRATYAALKKLEDEGLTQLNDGFYLQSRLHFVLDKPSVYEYQVKNPKLDPVIKTILRLTGGEVFGNYIFINEGQVAKLIKTDATQVRQWLVFLHEQEVIDYQPSTDQTQLTFLTPRLDHEKLPINQAQIEGRRKLALDKAQAVIDYMESSECRTNIFQRYFDEEPEGVCGICDNDLASKKVSKPPIKKVKALLEQSDKGLQELKMNLPEYTPESISNALRSLMEDGIVEDEKGFYRITR